MARKDDETDHTAMYCDICEEKCIQYHLCKECAKFSESPDDTAGICYKCKADGKKCVHEKDTEHVLQWHTPDYCEVVIETPDEDITLYLRASIEESFPKEAAVTDLGSRRRGVNFTVWQCYRDPKLFNRIIQHIVDNADGRFLLAREYIKHFQNKNNMRDIEAALENKEDDGTEKVFPFYEEDMDRITKQEYEHKKLAVEILSTIFFAKRNLTLAELLQAHATRDGDTKYQPSGETEMRDILYATKGLVTIERITSDGQDDNSDMIVRFEHLTRREYFSKYWTKWFPTGKMNIAKTCLTFLGFDTFAKPCTGEEDFQSKERKLPFVSYAVQFWGDHVREAGPDATEVVKQAVKYLKDPLRVEAFIEAAWTANTRDKDKWDVRRTIHPLHIIAWFDLPFLMESLEYDSKLLNVREETHGQTPLMYACRRGNVTMVRRLLESGASVNTQSEKGRTALFEAILRLKKNPEHNSNLDIEKSLQIVNLLLDERLRGRQLDINMVNPKHLEQPALVMSIIWKQIDIALAILRHPSLQVNLQDLNGENALHIAAAYGLEEVVQEILRMPSVIVDLPEKSDNRTALLVAARQNCRPEVVDALLKRGADPCWKDGRGGTAILRAAEAADMEGREESFTILAKSMGEKLDLKCVDEDGRGLWHWAAASGSEKIIGWLKTRTSDSLNAPDAAGMTPLHEACMYGRLETAQLLLQLGADPAIRDVSGRTPLTVARQYGSMQVMDHFRSNGLADDLPSDDEMTTELPVWALAMQWKFDAIKARIASDPMLINTVEPRTRRTALHCALLVSDRATDNEDIQVTIARELLATGKCSPDDVDRNGQTPTHLAAMLGNAEAMKLLLSNDADYDAVDRYGMTPLRIAFKNRFLEVGILLIEAGATIDGTKLDLDELLFAALTAQDPTSVRRLMAEGANRMAQDEDGRTAEMAAKNDPKLLGILKSSKSHRFKAETVNEKREDGIDLIEDTIGDVEKMLEEIKGVPAATPGEVLVNGKPAKSVRFTPFSSGEIYFGKEEKKRNMPLVDSQPLAAV